MAVNLTKNGTALMAAYQAVVDGKSDTNWALFTYEGNDNIIRLAGMGEDGLEEMVEELSSGKVMYAFCRVQDPNSGLPKYVLINWTGEGVKDSRKGACANHVATIASFLKGAHVTINARAEDDVEPETILSKVAKASGANFNFHRQASNCSPAPGGPVGSVYQKTNAVEEIKRINEENVYTQMGEEVHCKQNIKAEEERQRVEQERKEIEEMQAAARAKRANRIASQIDHNQLYQKQQEKDTQERESQNSKEQLQKQQEQDHGSSQRTGINSAASVQKANEAKSLISQRSFNPKNVFERKEQSFDLNNRQPPSTTRPRKLQSPFLSEKSGEKEELTKPQAPQFAAPFVPDTPASPLTPVRAIGNISPIKGAEYDSPVSGPSSLAQDTPASPVQPEEGTTVEEEYSSEEFDNFDDDIYFVTQGQEEHYEPQQLYAEEEDLYENIYEELPTGVEGVNEAEGQGVCAKALYNYQAEDDTEITFNPDDIITGIEMLDEGWWRGFGPSGHYGIFPANYVELL